MERVGEIMDRLGFNKEADEGVKAAFVKNLIKQAYGMDVPLPAQYEKPKPQMLEILGGIEAMVQRGLSAPTSELDKRSLMEPQQLCFNLEDTPKVG